MAKPAARLTDLNTCPKTGHGTNATTSGSPNVLINGLPTLRVGDSTACGDAVAEGISSILINGQPIAFLGSATAHGGVIITGSGDVVVGTQSGSAPFTAPEVLPNLGYGASRNDLQRVGGSGDGGIDGVISLDKLGLEKVYVQAKRWQGTVGRPELQAFYGALAGQKAKRGVFITTSGFTAQAIDFSRSVEGMVLVDGSRLVNLMMDHEVGVTSRLLKLPKLDSDYFDEE